MGTGVLRRWSRRARVAVALAIVVVVSMPLSAVADNVVADGDGIVPVADNNLSMGDVCTGQSLIRPVLVAAKRTGSGTSTNWDNGATLTITAARTVGPANFTPVVTDNRIELPSNWTSLGSPPVQTDAIVGLADPTASVNVIFSAPPSTTGLYQATVQVTASGEAAATGSNTVTRNDDVIVTANVVSCDTTSPTLNLPANIIAEATKYSGAAVSYTATADDANPAHPAVTCFPFSGYQFPIGTTTVNCSATDAAGNTAYGSFSVKVQDTTPPADPGPRDITVEATGPDGATVSYPPVFTAFDLVDGPVPVTCAPTSPSLFPVGTTTVVCSATDSHGNTGYYDFDVIVRDSTAPVLALSDVEAEATGPEGATVDYSGSVSAADVVDLDVAIDCVPPPGTFPLGDTPVDCTATDDAGNATSGSFTVSVVDTTAPELTLPASFSVEATGRAGATATFDATATDLVDGAVPVTCRPPSGSTFPLGATTVTCTATDAAGNEGSGAFVVTVVDTTPPELTLPADALLEATGPGGAAHTFTATATDVVDGDVAVTCSANSGDTFPLGTTTVECSASDAAGNVAMGSFTVEVQDTTPPDLTLPASFSVEATGPSGAAVDFAASAVDIVDGAVAATCDPGPSVFPLGATLVTCSATDAAGNTTSGSFTVTVVDTTPPELTGLTDVTAEATGPAGAAVAYTVTATDLVDGAVSASCSPPSGSTFALDVTTTVDCSASDSRGNTATGSFTVTVQDTTPPSVTPPGNVTTGPNDPFGAYAAYGAATATDLVDGAVGTTCTPASGSLFGFGTTTVTCSAADTHGNTGSASLTVTVTSFTFSGFYSPVDNLPTLNTVKGGSTVPVKWELFGQGGVEITSTATVVAGWPKATKVSCTTLSGIEDAIETTATGSTSLRYDTTAGQFIYNWQTPKQAGTCWQLDVKLTDGTTHSALFKLK